MMVAGQQPHMQPEQGMQQRAMELWALTASWQLPGWATRAASNDGKPLFAK